MVYFQTKNPNSGKFGHSCNGRFWYILWPFDKFSARLAYFVVIWYIFPVLVHCTKKNLATPNPGLLFFAQLNPQHAVPTLVDGDFVLTESRAIVVYIVEAYGKNTELLPACPKVRARY
jgi:hypothetical protein